MYFIGLDVHKKTISYCVKDAAGRVFQEGKIGSTRRKLDGPRNKGHFAADQQFSLNNSAAECETERGLML